MGKIFNYYANDVDKVWYNSSNIIYSECDDKADTLKTVRVVFKDGRTYQYESVDVNDYLRFRENSSQGKALNQFLKQYKATKLDTSDISKINEELENKMKYDFFLFFGDKVLNIFNSNDELIYEFTLTNDLSEEVKTLIIKILQVTNVKFKIK
jgi:hypothetical protein